MENHAQVDEPTLRESAEQWMREHPIAMDLFRRFAAELAVRRRRFGIKLLAERVRWECRTEGYDEADFKINNNWSAYIARALVREMPALAELLECRVTRAADRPARHPVRAATVDPLTEEPAQ